MTIQLFNGDCLEVMDKLIADGIKVDAVITDPPYGKLNKKCNWDKIIPIKEMWSFLLNLCCEDTPIILFAQEPYTSLLINSQKDLFKYKLYWLKTQPTGFLNAKRQPLRNIEEILVFYKKQCTYNPQKSTGHKPVNSYTKSEKTANNTVCYGHTRSFSGGGSTERYPTQILQFKSDKQRLCLHPTQKPVELLEYLIKTYTNEGDTVLDFTMGSGTTGVACKNLNRNFIGIELDKKYFDIAEKRINETTL